MAFPPTRVALKAWQNIRTHSASRLIFAQMRSDNGNAGVSRKTRSGLGDELGLKYVVFTVPLITRVAAF